MRILLISDIHANLTAFQKVLDDAAGQWDEVWCLGDIIGYGPDPNECVALLREQTHISLCGNHDWAGLGKIDISIFNRDARSAIEWTQAQLTNETIDYLSSLSGSTLKEPFTLAHASPREPIWEYIADTAVATANLDHFDTPYCLVGHTHVAVTFLYDPTWGMRIKMPDYDQPLKLGSGRFIINPGSVGQPRDADPRAAYALLDTEALTFQHRRVAYPIQETQSRMMQHGLPSRLIARLQYGY
jgi:diadenosine tetraphosphatase ApaH/serine/threonine PP2A family protein phosphatase